MESELQDERRRRIECRRQSESRVYTQPSAGRRLNTRGSSRRRACHMLGRPGNCGRMADRCSLGTRLQKSLSPGAAANDADLGILGRPSHWQQSR